MPSADECRRHPRACGGKRSQKSEKAASLAPAEHTESGCPRRRWETLFASIIGGLLRENSIPPGAIMDAGANTGTEACYFALHAPDRTVYALDPVPANVRHMERHYGGSFPNLMPKVGALGERPGTMQGVSVATRKSARSEQIVGGDQVVDLFAQVRRDGDESRRTGPRSVGALRVFTVDEIFANETLGFAHWDVEGSEWEVLSGARGTISRDLPIFTVETFMHTRPQATERLLSLVASLGYESWLVDEVCGHPLDCRNVINFPRGRRLAALRAASPTLELAAASGRLLRLANGTIDQMRSRVYPCCRPGGACCPDPPPPRGGGVGCCSQAAVTAWLDGNENRPRRAAGPADVPAAPRCYFC